MSGLETITWDERIELERKINEALTGNECILKEYTSPKIINTREGVREFVSVILEFDWEELVWCVDISWEIAPFWSILLTNRSLFLIEEDPFYLWNFLFCRYTNHLGKNKELYGLYFPDIPLDIEFPEGYKFSWWTDSRLEAENSTGDRLIYTFDNIRAYAKYIAYKRELDELDIDNSDLDYVEYVEKVFISPKKIPN